MTESQQLLAEYVENGSETAFRSCSPISGLLFIRRHPSDCGDSQLAETFPRLCSCTWPERPIPAKAVLLGGCSIRYLLRAAIVMNRKNDGAAARRGYPAAEPKPGCQARHPA